MASPTSKDTTPAPMQAPTAAPTGGTPPTLPEGVDPVLLMRLYPDAVDLASAKTKALAAGQAAYALGATIIAAQQEPVG